MTGLNLELLSKYRTQLMGTAMLWILLYHLPIFPANEELFFFKNIGYGGVDMFLFLSGMGLYFSLAKNDNILTFYKRRLIRILPAFFIVVLAFTIIYAYLGIVPNNVYSVLFYNLTTLGFWLNVGRWETFGWFIPSLLFFYIITPIWYKVFKKYKIISTVGISLLGIILSICLSASILAEDTSHFVHWGSLLLAIRIPIYFMGILAGYYVQKNYKLNTIQSVISILLLLTGFVFLYYAQHLSFDYAFKHGLLFYPFILITFPLLMLLSKIFTLFKNYKFSVFTFLGTYSLCIYLLNERLIRLFTNITDGSLEIMILTIILTLILSYFLQKGTSKIFK